MSSPNTNSLRVVIHSPRASDASTEASSLGTTASSPETRKLSENYDETDPPGRRLFAAGLDENQREMDLSTSTSIVTEKKNDYNVMQIGKFVIKSSTWSYVTLMNPVVTEKILKKTLGEYPELQKIFAEENHSWFRKEPKIGRNSFRGEERVVMVRARVGQEIDGELRYFFGDFGVKLKLYLGDIYLGKGIMITGAFYHEKQDNTFEMVLRIKCIVLRYAGKVFFYSSTRDIIIKLNHEDEVTRYFDNEILPLESESTWIWGERLVQN